ncbi:MAG: cyclic pyranopterin monophosphate synthase MoaC [bacterium]|jgi:cyclic pyranopterin monophosphate synthase|nr:cyclic pyranopterin monophosphate synthase MoaC [bacterium]
MNELTHIGEDGAVKMVDVTDKAVTDREAEVGGRITMKPETVRLIVEGRAKKGNVLETARIAGIMAAKRTWEIIPLCHPISITGIDLTFKVGEAQIDARASVRVPDRTGVEMEALTAVSVALLTIYDMCKAVDRGMIIGDIRLMRKSGGRSGTYVRSE